MSSHYLAILAAYAAVVCGWWLASTLLHRLGIRPASWSGSTAYELPRPWREVGFALLGALGVIAVGQLWTRGWMLPATGTFAPIIEAVNQVLIFLPILAVPFLRRQGVRTMLLPSDRVGTRLLVGLVLAFVALIVFAIVRTGSRGAIDMAAGILRFENTSQCVQVLCEDLAIGILLFRVASAASRRWAVALVAALFALGHIPALLSGGASAAELASLGLDFGLGVMMAGTVLRSGDILWFWPVHFALDMTQFARITGL